MSVVATCEIDIVQTYKFINDNKIEEEEACPMK